MNFVMELRSTVPLQVPPFYACSSPAVKAENNVVSHVSVFFVSVRGARDRAFPMATSLQLVADVGCP